MHSTSLEGHNASVRISQIALGLSVFAIIWLLLVNFTQLAAPADNIEQLNWIRAMEWGYFKHPPLPTWLLGIGVWLFGSSAELTYLMGALCTIASMTLLWGFLSRVRGSNYATLRGPIRVVAGTSALAGALSIELSERPMVLIDGNYAFSPWVAPDLVSRCGLLIVGEKAVLPTGTPVGAKFPMLSWAIVPPHEGV